MGSATSNHCFVYPCLFCLFPDLMQFTQPSMMVLAWLRFSADTNTCRTRSLSLCTEGKFTGQTGAQTHSPKPTSGQETMSQWCREPTHSRLICRFIIRPDNHKVRGVGHVGCREQPNPVSCVLVPIPYNLQRDFSYWEPAMLFLFQYIYQRKWTR